MIALLRYQAANLIRSHRWIVPVIVYALLISVGGAGPGGAALADGLAWSAAILVPAMALLTRSLLTAEPAAARACVSAASGPARAQFATLAAAFIAGALLGLAGVGYELATSNHHAGLLTPAGRGPGQGAGLRTGRVGGRRPVQSAADPASGGRAARHDRRGGSRLGREHFARERRAARERRGYPVPALADRAPAGRRGRAGRARLGRIVLAGRAPGGLGRLRGGGRRIFAPVTEAAARRRAGPESLPVPGPNRLKSREHVAADSGTVGSAGYSVGEARATEEDFQHT